MADVPFGVVTKGLTIGNYFEPPYPDGLDAMTVSEAAFFNRALTAGEMSGLASAAGL